MDEYELLSLIADLKAEAIAKREKKSSARARKDYLTAEIKSTDLWKLYECAWGDDFTATKDVTIVEEKLKKAAIAYYRLTGNRKPAEGVNVFDDPKASLAKELKAG